MNLCQSNAFDNGIIRLYCLCLNKEKILMLQMTIITSVCFFIQFSLLHKNAWILPTHSTFSSATILKKQKKLQKGTFLFQHCRYIKVLTTIRLRVTDRDAPRYIHRKIVHVLMIQCTLILCQHIDGTCRHSRIPHKFVSACK